MDENAVRIMTRLWAGPSGFRFPTGARNSSLLQGGQTGSTAHPTCCWKQRGVKRQGCEDKYSTPSSAKVTNDRSNSASPLRLHRNKRSYTSAPSVSSSVQEDYVTFTLCRVFTRINVAVTLREGSYKHLGWIGGRCLLASCFYLHPQLATSITEK